MQAIGRWGNFFNQELYGPPTNLPWGIAIDCAHRVAEYPCPPSTRPRRRGFHPLFLYESMSGILGAITLLWIARRWGPRMRPGDLLLIFLIWYATVRFALESLRDGQLDVLRRPDRKARLGAGHRGAARRPGVRHRPGAADGDAGAIRRTRRPGRGARGGRTTRRGTGRGAARAVDERPTTRRRADDEEADNGAPG